MTRSQTQTTTQANVRWLKKVFLLDYLQSNHMTVCFSESEENTLYLEQAGKTFAQFVATIITLMEAINFIVIFDCQTGQLEGYFYSPPEGLYAGLPPIHFISFPKIEEKVSDDS